MKLKIYEEEKEDEDIVTLRLQKDEDDDDIVNVVAVDKYGYQLSAGLILGISEEGVKRYGSVNSSLNFCRDSNKKIHLIK